MAIICFSVFGAVAAFLRYNYSPARIFMGDTGSLMLGFLASAVVLEFIRHNANLPESHYLQFSNPISIVSVALVYPLFDTLRVFTIRVMSGRSPFSADRNHIHHLLLNVGFSHTKAVTTILSLNILLMFIVVALRNISDNILVPCIVLFSSILAFILQYFSAKKLAIKAHEAEINH